MNLELLKLVKATNFAEIQKTAREIDRSKDKGISSQMHGTGIITKENGDTEITSSEFASIKLGANGVKTDISLQSNTITNTKNLKIDNLTINRHKLNPALWELTDFKKIDGNNSLAIGDLNMYGTVLVKAYEHTLKRHVLIRRPTRMPLFSTTLDIPNVPNNLRISSNLEKDLMEYLSEKGNK